MMPSRFRSGHQAAGMGLSAVHQSANAEAPCQSPQWQEPCAHRTNTGSILRYGSHLQVPDVTA
jgi:hypothetical protein